MKNNLKDILIISSANPSVAAGVLAVNYHEALKNAGYNVDFLTKDKNSDYPEFLYVHEPKVFLFFKRCSVFFKRVFFKIFRIIVKRDYKILYQRCFFYKYEDRPPISASKVLGSLPKEKNYDLIIVLFWQGMLSAKSLEAIYDRYKCQFFVMCVDYSPMTGGCHFIADCKTFEKGCGACEAWYSNNEKDFTYKNILEKKRIYEKIKPVLFMNKYMDENYASKSPALINVHKEYKDPVINEDLFCPVEKKSAKRILGIDEDAKVIFFACQNLKDTRKGGKYVLDALEIFYNAISESEREEILIILAGRSECEIASRIQFRYKTFGYVDSKKLIQLYQASDLYLSGSVIDAGPMMVNYALSCGIPVVAFNIGTAIDVVNGKNTGYCATEITSQAFAEGIKWWHNLSDSQYSEICKNCRNIALKTTSYKVFVNRIVEVYESLCVGND